MWQILLNGWYMFWFCKFTISVTLSILPLCCSILCLEKLANKVKKNKQKKNNLRLRNTGQLFRLCPLQIQSLKSGSSFVLLMWTNATRSSTLNFFSFWKLNVTYGHQSRSYCRDNDAEAYKIALAFRYKTGWPGLFVSISTCYLTEIHQELLLYFLQQQPFTLKTFKNSFD